MVSPRRATTLAASRKYCMSVSDTRVAFDMVPNRDQVGSIVQKADNSLDGKTVEARDSFQNDPDLGIITRHVHRPRS